jgi:hypothetical protein
MDAYCERLGAYVGTIEERNGFIAQRYSNDIILIARKSENIEKMLEVRENFMNWSQIEGDVKKCATASFLLDINIRRCSLRDQLRFKGRDILDLTFEKSPKYLGTPVAAQCSVKLEAVETKLSEARGRPEKIMRSELLITSQIDALTTVP